MKKLIAIVLTLLMLCALALPASAAPTPLITQQPQSPVYQENAKADYRVTVKGKNLECLWFLVTVDEEGKEMTYNLSDRTADHPWKDQVELSQSEQKESVTAYTTFTCRFKTIPLALNGSRLYAIVGGSISATAYIQVAAQAGTPPIINATVDVTATQGDTGVECSVTPRKSEWNYRWYEASDNNLDGKQPVGTQSSFVVDTSTAGTRNYVCVVTTADGGKTLSCVIPVTVEPLEITGEDVLEAAEGSNYDFQFTSNGANASFDVSDKDRTTLEQYGLTLTKEGLLQGKPTKAGTCTFAVKVKNNSVEVTRNFTLKIQQTSVILDVMEAPAKQVYQIGETLDLTGLRVKIQNPDGTVIESKDGEGLTVPTEPFTEAGEQVIKAAYGDSFVTFRVKVEEAADSTEPTEPATEPTEPDTQNKPSDLDTPQPDTVPATTDPGNSQDDDPGKGPTKPTVSNAAPDKDDDGDSGIPWWLLLIAVIAAAGIGVCVTVLIMQKKQLTAPVPVVAAPAEKEDDHGYTDVPEDVGLDDSVDAFLADSGDLYTEASAAPFLTEPENPFLEDTAEDAPEEMRSLFDK